MTPSCYIDWQVVDVINVNTTDVPSYTLPPNNLTAETLFWPANFGVGVSPCMQNGFYYTVKPLSYFCPVACGCRAGDLHCPDQCPRRFDGGTNADGHVDYSSLEPNPSPRNVDGFPWQYASRSPPSSPPPALPTTTTG